MSLQRIHPPVLQPVPPAVNVAPVAPVPAVSHAPSSGGTEQPFFRFDIVRALELHRRLAMTFAIVGLVLAVAYAVYAWPKYVAESQIYIQPTSAKILDQGNNSQRWPYDSNSYDSFIQQQVQLASNPDVLVNAMHKLPQGSWQRANESEQAAAGRLGGVLKVERLGSSYQVAITAQAKSADMAADIANAVANSIVEKAGHEANAGNTERLAILEGERDRVQNQLNADLTEQGALNKQLGMAAVGTEAPDLIDNAIGATRDELIKARTDHDEAEARFESLGAGKSASSAALDAEADDLIASDAGLTSMKTSLNSRRATLITQMANLTPNNPEYKLDAEELSKINTSLDAMMAELRAKAAGRIQEKLRTDLERTSAVEAQLNGQLRQLAATAASATPKLQRANDLATDIVRLRARYATVDEALHDLQLQDSVPGAVHLSVAAAPPLHPSLVGILRKSVPLALGGIILGLLAALIATQLDPRIYIASDVEHLLGFAPMIALPDCTEIPDAVFDEHILRLATAIEHARKQGSLRTCIFTGTGAGTGVTTVVTQVRNMLSSMGRATVLVNATGTGATGTGATGTGATGAGVSETGQRAARTGLQEANFQETSLQEIEPRAERITRSVALVQRMTAETGAEDESLVLTDTAPLLISAETEYLARFVDCAIVVVESGATTRAELRATADALQRLNVAAVGLVLNRVGLAKADAAFRKSVRGMEAHIREQGRADQRAASRPRHYAEEMPAVVMQRESPQRESPQRESPRPVVRPQAAGARYQDSNRYQDPMQYEDPIEDLIGEPIQEPVQKPDLETNLESGPEPSLELGLEPALVHHRPADEPEQPVAHTEPVAATPVIPDLRPVAQERQLRTGQPVLNEAGQESKIAKVESVQNGADRTAEEHIMAERFEKERIAAETIAARDEAQATATQEPGTAGTIAGYGSEETIAAPHMVMFGHANHEKNQRHGHPDYSLPEEYTRSEYARSEHTFPVYTPEPASSEDTTSDFSTRHGKDSVAAADETVWSAPLAASHPSFTPPKRVPMAQKHAASAPDSNVPWWLSEAPLTITELAVPLPQTEADEAEERVSQPASDEAVRLPASRLSGLRSVIFGTGPRAPRRREVEEREFENQVEPAFEQQAESRVEPLLINEARTPHEALPFYESPAPAAAAIPVVVEAVPVVAEAVPVAVEAVPVVVEAVAHPFEPAAPAFVPEPVAAPMYARMPEPVLPQADPEQIIVVHEAPHIIAMPEIVPPQPIATPAILPPQPIAAPRHRPDPWGSEPKRLDRGDTFEDMPVLPSRRGQYRRRVRG